MSWRVPVGEWAGRAAFILGGGPSLADLDVERIRGRGKVIAVNNAGFKYPWADVLYFADGMSRWFGWNRHRLHEFHGDLIVSREAVPQLDPRIRVLPFTTKFPLSRHPGMVSGFCGGSSAINLAYLMGARVIVLMGFDMRGGNWHDEHKLPPVKNCHRERFIPALERMAPELEADGCLVLNTCEHSALRCFPFADFEELMSMDDLARIEADKYRRIWERPEYRKISPGMLEVDRAWLVCEMQAGESITDYGSGTGRATAWFRDRGLHVLAVDHADNALETSVPFVNACLWSMGDEVPFSDYAYCCDVMEHIPREKVADVLEGIASRTLKSAYFRIATRPDQMGRLIGHPLHLTVEGGEWWRRQLEAQFTTVDVVGRNERDIMLLARP